MVLTVFLAIPIKWGISDILSLINVMLAASTLMSLPMSPIAIPIFAFLKDGASFTPSPIIPTLCPKICSLSMYSSLSSGKQSDLTFLIFISFAIDFAVFSLSPVISVVFTLNPFNLRIVSFEVLRNVSVSSIFPMISVFFATYIGISPFVLTSEFKGIFSNSKSFLFPATIFEPFMNPLTPLPICILKSFTSANSLLL